MMKNLIQVKYYFKEHPKTTLSIYLETQEQVEAFKTKHPDYVYITENNLIMDFPKEIVKEIGGEYGMVI